MTTDYSNDFPSELSDWEHVEVLDGVTVRISKVGGGTVGRSYGGAWHYRVEFPFEDPIQGSDLVSGSPTTHHDAAEIALEMAPDRPDLAPPSPLPCDPPTPTCPNRPDDPNPDPSRFSVQAVVEDLTGFLLDVSTMAMLDVDPFEFCSERSEVDYLEGRVDQARRSLDLLRPGAVQDIADLALALATLIEIHNVEIDTSEPTALGDLVAPDALAYLVLGLTVGLFRSASLEQLRTDVLFMRYQGWERSDG